MKRLLFVDDEPRVLQGLERQLRRMRSQWELCFAESGPEALAFMARAPAEVVVSDMLMPGMDGAQLLSEIRRLYPGTIRLVLSGHSGHEAVLRLVGSAHQYLTKPCDVVELRNAIERSLALRDLLSNDQLKQLASRIHCLPSLPTRYVKLNEELRKEEPNVERIARTVSKDVAMTAKILQLVNSAFFGVRQQATTIQDAVAYLGLATLRALALSVQVFFPFNQQGLPWFPMDEFTVHCWRTGLLARRIAQLEKASADLQEHCFLAGLLHDAGCLVMASGLPLQYSRVLAGTRTGGRPICEIEKDQIGVTHAESGAYLLGLWGLPNPVVEAVAYHHQPSAGPVTGFTPVIAVHTANALLWEGHPTRKENLDLALLERLGLGTRVEVWRQSWLADSQMADLRLSYYE